MRSQAPSSRSHRRDVAQLEMARDGAALRKQNEPEIAGGAGGAHDLAVESDRDRGILGSPAHMQRILEGPRQHERVAEPTRVRDGHLDVNDPSDTVDFAPLGAQARLHPDAQRAVRGWTARSASSSTSTQLGIPIARHSRFLSEPERGARQEVPASERPRVLRSEMVAGAPTIEPEGPYLRVSQ